MKNERHLLIYALVMIFLLLSFLGSQIRDLNDRLDQEIQQRNDDDRFLDDRINDIVSNQEPIIEDTQKTQVLVVPEVDVVNTDPRIEVTDEELDLIARVIEMESSICDLETKHAVGSVVINRVLSDLYPDNVVDVIYQTGQFDTSDMLFDREPSDDALIAARMSIMVDSVDSATVFLVRRISGPKSLQWLDSEIDTGRYVFVAELDKEVEFYKVVK